MGRSQEAGRLAVNAGGKIEISAEQWREYQNLLRKRDNTVESIRTQMRLQNAEALRLAHAVVSEFCAGKAFELANELLLTE